MSRSDEEKWDRIHQADADTPARTARILAENLHLLPKSGTALDVACGKGGNALLLARHGLTTHAWDISQTALDFLARKAAEASLTLYTAKRDVVMQPPTADAFDVIIATYFLERSIISALITGLRRNGLIFYQTFIKDKRDGYGPNNPDYRLDNNELLRLFFGMRVLYYREEGTVGDLNAGFRNEAMLIAQKTASGW